jgi:hypothetical protein
MRQDSTLNDLYEQRKLVRRCVDYQSPVITFTDLRGDSQKHKKAATFFFSQDAKKHEWGKKLGLSDRNGDGGC